MRLNLITLSIATLALVSGSLTTKKLNSNELDTVKTAIRKTRGEEREKQVKAVLGDSKIANYELLTFDELTNVDLQYERLEYFLKLFFDLDEEGQRLLKKFIELFSDEDSEAEVVLAQFLARLPVDLKPVYEDLFRKGLYPNSRLFQELLQNRSFRDRVQADLKGTSALTKGTTLAHDYLQGQVVKSFSKLYEAGREFGIFDKDGFTPLMKAVLKDYNDDIAENTKRLSFDSATPEETRLEWIAGLVLYGADPQAKNGDKSVQSLSREKAWNMIKETAWKLSKLRDRINAVFQDPRLPQDIKDVLMGHFDDLKDDILAYVVHKYTYEAIPDEVGYVAELK